MLRGLVWLLACQLVGEVLVRAIDVDVPGAVVGMALLFVVLQLRRPADGASVLVAADALLAHLQLLFIPAGVGIVAYAATLRDDALPIGVALVGSWLAGLAVVGWLATWTGRRTAEVR
ncbi:unannotated protein [freshwater metagenome]|uniref:Unannotated protein n=1 Tax=freshwater metagenome TaxID=449393 RepID=A0A6J6Q449_9ZZZZ